MRTWLRLAAGAFLLATLSAIWTSPAAAKPASGIPATARSELLRDAKREAARLPYRRYRLHDIQAIVTSEAKAWELENQSRGVQLPCGHCGRARVYLVAMLDERECRRGMKTPASCPTHPPVLMFWVSPSTMKVGGATRGGSYPDLASVGVPVPLAGPGA